MTTKRFFIAFALVAVVLAGVVSLFASSAPDALERTAEEQGISAAEKKHASDDSPFADYGEDGAVSGGVAGVAGVGVVLVLAGGIAFAVRRRQHHTADSESTSTSHPDRN